MEFGYIPTIQPPGPATMTFLILGSLGLLRTYFNLREQRIGQLNVNHMIEKWSTRMSTPPRINFLAV